MGAVESPDQVTQGGCEIHRLGGIRCSEQNAGTCIRYLSHTKCMRDRFSVMKSKKKKKKA